MNEVKWEKLISDSLQAAGKEIAPSRDLLTKIVAAIDQPAILRPVKAVETISKWQSLFSFASGQRTLVSAGTIMILAVIFLSLPANLRNINHPVHRQFRVSSALPAQPGQVAADQDINKQPLTTDDVEAAVFAILSSVSDEDSTLTDGVKDESLSDEDSAAINNLMQNYDQDQL